MILSEDGVLVASAIGALGVITAFIQLAGIKWVDGRVYLRKVLHLLVILTCAYVINSIESTLLLQWIFLGFAGLLFSVVKNKLLNISQGESFGIALFPLAFAILLMIDGLPRSYIVTSAILLAIADPLAGLVGKKYARSFWTPLNEEKSWLGCLVFLISCLLLLAFCQSSSWVEINPKFGWLGLILIALLTTLSELFSWRGSDNFFIPIIVALSMQAIAIHGTPQGAMVAGAVLVLGYGLTKMRWLNVSGMLAVVLMATWIALMISPLALLLPVAFLVIGSLLSKLNRGDKSLSKDDSNGRDAHQVFANGGMGMVMAVPYLLTHNESYLVLFALVFAAATSDTASSEIGRRIKGTTWNIATFRKVIPGQSGGMSLLGSIAGFLGALIIAAMAYFIFELSTTDMIKITAFGFGGMVIDSFLGAFLQAKYRVHGILLEEGRKDQLISGYHWIDNSMVNFLSVGFVVLVGYIIL